jgi:hypothetical protein
LKQDEPDRLHNISTTEEDGKDLLMCISLRRSSADSSQRGLASMLEVGQSQNDRRDATDMLIGP